VVRYFRVTATEPCEANRPLYGAFSRPAALARKSLIEERAAYRFRIPLTNALGTNDIVPGRAYSLAHVRDDCPRLLLRDARTLTHWTGAKHRLDREFGKRFGDQAYAAEELVAEIGAAFLCAELRITQETRPDHAQYLARWLTLLKGDQRALFAASAKGVRSRDVSERCSAEERSAARTC
jgi:hypothetical protein